MQQIDPNITADNVRIKYQDAGLGFAGNPAGMDIDPLVTVELTGLEFNPVTGLALASFTMPDFHTSLTAEDSVGSQSN